MAITVQQFKYNDWNSQWAGNWPILLASSWGAFYSRTPFTDTIDQYVTHTIIFWEHGQSSAYQRLSEKEVFAKKVMANLHSNANEAERICAELEKATDDFMAVMETYAGVMIAADEYERYVELLERYYRLHIQVKVSVDFLPAPVLKKLLPRFTKARLHAEPVFSRVIEFIQLVTEAIYKKTGMPAPLLQAMTQVEFIRFLKTGEEPSRTALKERNERCGLLCCNGEVTVVTDGKLDAVKEIVVGNKPLQEIKGSVAYPGCVRGTARLVFDPRKADHLQEGDILVTGMTRPEYLPVMKRAAAFVTDGGGILCHAAIIAREMAKPCIIGTRIATKVLNDGDMVEVDAEKGVVRKIS